VSRQVCAWPRVATSTFQRLSIQPFLLASDALIQESAQNLAERVEQREFQTEQPQLVEVHLPLCRWAGAPSAVSSLNRKAIRSSSLKPDGKVSLAGVDELPGSRGVRLLTMVRGGLGSLELEVEHGPAAC
jgi:hypothetical protein